MVFTLCKYTTYVHSCQTIFSPHINNTAGNAVNKNSYITAYQYNTITFNC